MKKIFMFFAAVAMAAGIASAQDINSVTETYNNGAMELEMGNKEAALTAAEALGEEGMQIADNCKSTIPVLMESIAKDYIKAQMYDAAIEQLNKTIEVCNTLGNAAQADECKTLIYQTLMAKGNDLINAKDFAAAIEVYNQIMAADPTTQWLHSVSEWLTELQATLRQLRQLTSLQLRTVRRRTHTSSSQTFS